MGRQDEGGFGQPPEADALRFDLGKLRQERTQRRSAREQRRVGARRLYSDAEGQPILRTSNVLYLDELGTSAPMRDLTAAGLRAVISDYDALAGFVNAEDDDVVDANERYLSFSDNLVVGSPIDAVLPYGGLFFSMWSAAAYQLNLALRGRFLRGGITQGPLYMDHRIALGAGLLEAIRLEEQVATYPRIVVIDRAINGILKETRYESDPTRSVENNMLLIDADGRMFLNYLMLLTEDGATSDISGALRRHAEVVTGRLAEFRDNPRVREKYVWVADYHDYVCASIMDMPDLALDDGSGRTDYESLYPRTFRRLVR
jgi:hypothetical protein